MTRPTIPSPSAMTWVAVALLVLLYLLDSNPVHAITVPVDNIPLERPTDVIQSRKFTVDNRGYAHVNQALNDAGHEYLGPYSNGTDPRNRRIIPVMTFYVPSTGVGGGGGAGQYYHQKARPQEQILLEQQQLPPPHSHHQHHNHQLQPHHQQQANFKGHHVLGQSAAPQRFNSNQYSQQLAKPGHYPIVHPSIGPNVVQKQPHLPPHSISLVIANNYRAAQQYHQASPHQQQQQQQQPQQVPQFEVLNRRPNPGFQAPQQLPQKYAPSLPTKLPLQFAQQSQSPLQIFYSGGGGGGRSPSASSPKLNNQPYVILASGGTSAEKQQQQLYRHNPNHRPGPAPHQHHHSGSLQSEQANENQHHNLLTSPEVQQSHFIEAGKGITPFLPSNKVPGSFRPMISSQKVGHVPQEVFQQQQQYEQQEIANAQAEEYRVVSTTEKPIKYKYQLYQPQVATERPFYEEYSPQQQQFNPVPTHGPSVADNELDEERQNYYSSLKSLNLQQAAQRPLNYDAPQPSESPSYAIASTTAKPRPIKAKFSSTYRAGYFDSAGTSTTPAPHKSSIVPSFRPLQTTAYYSQTSTEAPPVHHHPSKFYATTGAPHFQPPPPTGQHLTETTFIGHPTKISTYHPKINHLKPIAFKHPQQHQQPDEFYYPLDQGQAVATTPVPRPVSQNYKVNNNRHGDILLDDNQSLSELLKKLQDSNHLPKTLTPDNIDNSIKTLIKILNNLKQSPSSLAPDQHLQPGYNRGKGGGGGAAAAAAVDEDYTDNGNNQDYYYDKDPLINDNGNQVDDHQLGANSGTPGVDYPNLFEIPPTEFNCKAQRYKGFFGDPETRCQVWHYCDLNGGQASFLCPNGTIFSQVALTCDWWFNVKCDTTAQLYVLNERLYKYILPFTPKFPEDYSGPLVDKYLALKFKEMEEKMRKQKGSRLSAAEGGEDLVEEVSEEDNDDELGGISSIDQGISKMDGASLDVTERVEVRQTTTTRPVKLLLGSSSVTASTTTTEAPSSLEVQEVTGSNELEVSKERIIEVTRAPPNVLLSSQSPPFVEIKSDGNSGHLNPRLRLRGR